MLAETRATRRKTWPKKRKNDGWKNSITPLKGSYIVNERDTINSK